MSTPLQYSIVGAGPGEESILVLIPGRDPLHAHSDQPAYQEIKRLVLEGTDDVDHLVGLFNPALIAAEKFSGTLSERVVVRDGVVFFDNDPVDDALTAQIVRFVDEGVEDWQPLVAFFEKVRQNPQAHAQRHLYNWLNAHETTITPEGDLVLYKGVRSNGDGAYCPTNRGVGIVNGGPPNSQSEYTLFHAGDVVEMPRSNVAHLPHAECATGLHVGTQGYASGYGDTVLRVLVNPRDVVNVPDAGTKLRTCRYRVVEAVERDRNAPDSIEPVYQPHPHDLRDDEESEEYDCDNCEDTGCEDCEPEEYDTSAPLSVGDRVEDPDDDVGTILSWDPNKGLFEIGQYETFDDGGSTYWYPPQDLVPADE